MGCLGYGGLVRGVVGVMGGCEGLGDQWGELVRDGVMVRYGFYLWVLNTRVVKLSSFS